MFDSKHDIYVSGSYLNKFSEEKPVSEKTVLENSEKKPVSENTVSVSEKVSKKFRTKRR